MKFLRAPFVAFALVAFVAPVVQDANADLAAAKGAMINKAAEELVASPIQMVWKDVYEALVHTGGSKFLRRFMYSMSGLVGVREAESLSRSIMSKLKAEVFGGKVNEKMWKMLTMECYYQLRDWWLKTPENPVDSADLGVWHTLVNMHKNVIGPAMRGSSRVDLMNKILLDPDLKTIKRWVAAWKSGGKK